MEHESVTIILGCVCFTYKFFLRKYFSQLLISTSVTKNDGQTKYIFQVDHKIRGILA